MVIDGKYMNQKYSKEKQLQKSTIKKMYSERKITLNRLIKTFHKYIRLRDIQLPCISCGSWIKLQAGHYYNAGNYASLRFDEKNVNGQCVQCNYFKEGNKQGYRDGLIKKYGIDVLIDLKIKKNNISKLDVFELNCLNEEYKKKTKELIGYQNK
ncbi:unnamed protein product [marine sediment metagenome]|uniref:Protein ninG n=1 Tax=marine sediment metagenome TaxID=412755 RepID=X0VIC6_9ZZZZ